LVGGPFLQRRVLCEPLFNARQTGLDKQQAVQEKPALLACYREGINAHLMAEET
jgi:4-hydroxyphenylacetate 3-monooxygenase